MCQHIRTVSITDAGFSDMRRCLDCSEALSGREIASAQARRHKPAPDFLTEADYAPLSLEDRITAALTEGLEPGEVMSETAIRQALKSPTLRRLVWASRVEVEI